VSTAEVIQSRPINREVINDKSGWEAVMAYFKVPSQHLTVMCTENHENTCPGCHKESEIIKQAKWENPGPEIGRPEFISPIRQDFFLRHTSRPALDQLVLSFAATCIRD
jgi:hypothetical protein